MQNKGTGSRFLPAEYTAMNPWENAQPNQRRAGCTFANEDVRWAHA